MKNALSLVFLLACGGDAGTDTDADGVPTVDSQVDPTGPTGPGSYVYDNPDCDEPYPSAPIVMIEEVEEYAFDDLLTLVWMPESPRGVVYAFHGSGGDALTLLNPNWTEAYNRYICSGFGIVIAESLNRGSGKWEGGSTSPDSNEDVARMIELRADLIENTGLTQSTPQFSVGYSNGGEMAATWGQASLEQGFDHRAAAIHNSSGGSSNEFPTIFVASEHDATVSARSMENAYDNVSSRGVPTEYILHTEYAITVDWFFRLSYYKEDAQAEFAWQEMVDMGMIDDNGDRIADIDQVFAITNSYAANSEAVAAGSVSAQVLVAWATHRFCGDYADQEIDFFLNHLTDGAE